MTEKSVKVLSMAMPILCEIAREIGVDIESSAGKMKTYFEKTIFH
jgi:hypothetical protein